MTVKTLKQSLVKTILLTGLLCGTLDALAAIIFSRKVPAATIFKYIASGLAGKTAGDGGTLMVLYGVLIHYLIALVFTFAFLKLYPFFIGLFRNKILLAFVYGLIIFVVMNMIVVPYLSRIITKPLQLLGSIKNWLTLVAAFGFPIVFIAGKFFQEVMKQR
jgi:hypothetical protein